LRIKEHRQENINNNKDEFKIDAQIQCDNNSKEDTSILESKFININEVNDNNKSSFVIKKDPIHEAMLEQLKNKLTIPSFTIQPPSTSNSASTLKDDNKILNSSQIVEANVFNSEIKPNGYKKKRGPLTNAQLAAIRIEQGQFKYNVQTIN
jgi:hypothetical protein